MNKSRSALNGSTAETRTIQVSSAVFTALERNTHRSLRSTLVSCVLPLFLCLSTDDAEKMRMSMGMLFTG